ncbi:hypothetical protein Goshw_008175 [Gossypium schwendimanii]|uniref:Uncharacterized protein n=1 Tax=Gossypium schwendimanii TaxID=34291 RepID=A0A7J9KWN2_GOSSC|nr:hypothetical protein [Gossypium schwendimanii]
MKLVVTTMVFVKMDIGGFDAYDGEERLVKAAIEGSTFIFTIEWIYHHYFAMATALVSLTWEIKGQPNCGQKQRGVELFLQWAMMQGAALLLLNRYQRRRLYTRISLGKSNSMNVARRETTGVDCQLWVLCPILFVMQGFEAYVGLLLLKTAFARVVTEWQIIFCGIILVILAVGNFINTAQTLMAKSRFKGTMKKSKSRRELY